MLSFFVFFSARFSYRVLAGFFYSSFFLSWPLLIVTAPVVVRMFRVEPRGGSKIRAYLTGNLRAAKMASSRRRWRVSRPARPSGSARRPPAARHGWRRGHRSFLVFVLWLPSRSVFFCVFRVGLCV